MRISVRTTYRLGSDCGDDSFCLVHCSRHVEASGTRVPRIGTDGRHGERIQAVLHGAEADCNAQLGTVLASRKQPTPFSHRPSAAGIREEQAMADVRQAISLRQQQLDALALQLARRIPEQIAGLGICDHDCARLVDDEHRIGGAIENALQNLCRQHDGQWLDPW